ncbi:GNAT family N-acetyltransferase [Streptomyces sp. AP-93]|uniref:GNAT family N-acetyltransferase n=1 Tax=Streptomyces sp. AP-93 TaxID=2929048 RepID=UPI001FAEF3A0|nr:N-acetyltransferase [Streptomyces sp. AP-93]MCJ0874092.1 N-acetyltransferase [Streptomyces sp. AP-93]
MKSIKIRPETRADHPAVHATVAAAFGSAEEAGLVDALRTDPTWIDELSLVAEAGDGAIAGHATFTRAWIGTTPVLTLAVMSVHPACQKDGVGTALIRAGLDAARERRERTVTVLGHPDYYPRFGWERADAHGVTCTIANGPDEAKMVLSLDGTPIPTGDMAFGPTLSAAVAAYQPE